MGMCGVCVGMHGCVWVCTGVCGCARVCAGVRMCARVCTGVHKCVQVYIHVRGWVMVCVGVHTRTWVGVGVHVCVWKFAEVRGCLRVCVLDEFSEYLLETGVNTSADFNTYPIRIFFRSDYIQATEDEDVTKLFFFLTIFVFVRAVERLDYICVSK